MKLEDIHLLVGYNDVLADEDKEKLLKGYQNLYIKLYGFDIIASYFENEHNSSFKLKELFKIPKKEEILLIYKNEELIGLGRIKKLNKKEISLYDLLILKNNKDDYQAIWKKAISFMENYFANKNYKKMYIEIPISDTYLLFRADDLGFKESPNDIDIFNNKSVYVLNKEII